MQELKRVSSQFRKQLRSDRKCFLLEIAEAAKNSKPNEVFAALRPILQPSKKQSTFPKPLPVLKDENGDTLQTMEEVNARWVRHFAQLEAGKEVEVPEFVRRMLQRQQDSCKPAEYHVEDLPSRLELEKAIRKMHYRKAPGPDRLPNELLKASPGDAAMVLYPILLKMTCRLEEPLQWKGGQIFSLLKGKGQHSDCQNHRGILLTSVLGKAVPSSIRTRLNEPYLLATDDLQLAASLIRHSGFPTFR